MKMIKDIDISRKREMEIYVSSMNALYNNSVLQNGEIYDIAFELTEGFKKITADAVLLDSRIIKILRYSISPSISQMKFGQFFGLNSIEQFERDKLSEKSGGYIKLQKVVNELCLFVNKYLDRSRFLWLSERISDISLAHKYAKGWTCSIAADQNAQTAYRNWRKDQQELAISNQLIQIGYTKSSFSGVITKFSDINLGEFTKEQKVKGRTLQKADLIIRSKKSNKIILVEAKAVGVELDATKRTKECCDKANDWKSSKLLDNPKIIAVIGGFFSESNLENLELSGIQIVWEHRLSDLSEFL
ncbi:MAG TPA: XamI family restriction endonuclease [Leptospiraceae bacterium]|nr:XamI family restriction endonuclease [Leptospiraceae bacterium]